MWVAGKNCDPVNMCHSVELCDCLGRKNALCKYFILYSTFTLRGSTARKLNSDKVMQI